MELADAMSTDRASQSKQPHLSNQDLSKLVVENLDALSPEVISRQATINIGTHGNAVGTQLAAWASLAPAGSSLRTCCVWARAASPLPGWPSDFFPELLRRLAFLASRGDCVTCPQAPLATWRTASRPS